LALLLPASPQKQDCAGKAGARNAVGMIRSS
jgi:hypothetical protein